MNKDNPNRTEQGKRGSIALSRRRALVAAAQLGLGGAALAAAGRAGAVPSALAAGRDETLPRRSYHFVLVNHGTANPFFVPTKFGAADACDMLGCRYAWTGSQNRVVGEMTRAIAAAVAAHADGIAVSIIDRVKFDAPIAAAIRVGIPVVTYNADVPAGSPNKRLAYIGQNLYLSGQTLGERIVAMLPAGRHVALFIDTPHSLNVQPRIDGAKAAIDELAGHKITYEVIATGLHSQEKLARIEKYYLEHPNASGLFAVDGGSTASVAQLSRTYGLQKRGIATGGFDLLPATINGIVTGDLNFTIEQQPYQQGFYSIQQLYLYKLSGTLMAPSGMDTHLKVVTKANIAPYLHGTRFEGTSTALYRP